MGETNGLREGGGGFEDHSWRKVVRRRGCDGAMACRSAAAAAGRISIDSPECSGSGGGGGSGSGSGGSSSGSSSSGGDV
jgi:hypothetical protein